MSDKDAPVKRVYWDSNVFLSAINASKDRLPVIEAILDDCDHGDVEIYTSVLSITEVAFADSEKTERRLSPETQARIDKLWMPPSPIRVEEMSHPVANEARNLMRQAIVEGWTLKPPDAIHLASAKRRLVHEFHTYDVRRLSKFASITRYAIIEPRVDRLLFPPASQ